MSALAIRTKARQCDRTAQLRFAGRSHAFATFEIENFAGHGDARDHSDWRARCRLGSLALLLLHKGVRALRQFLRRDVLLVGGDVPGVAGWIFHAAAAGAVAPVGLLHDRIAASLCLS